MEEEVCTGIFSRMTFGEEFSGMLELVDKKIFHFQFIRCAKLTRVGKQLVLSDVDYMMDEYCVFVRGPLIVHMVSRGLKWWFDKR